MSLMRVPADAGFICLRSSSWSPVHPCRLTATGRATADPQKGRRRHGGRGRTCSLQFPCTLCPTPHGTRCRLCRRWRRAIPPPSPRSAPTRHARSRPASQARHPSNRSRSRRLADGGLCCRCCAVHLLFASIVLACMPHVRALLSKECTTACTICNRRAAFVISVQHSALSVQHSALSVQHSAIKRAGFGIKRAAFPNSALSVHVLASESGDPNLHEKQ
jgi:hypothetical protein